MSRIGGASLDANQVSRPHNVLARSDIRMVCKQIADGLYLKR